MQQRAASQPDNSKGQIRASWLVGFIEAASMVVASAKEEDGTGSLAFPRGNRVVKRDGGAWLAGRGSEMDRGDRKRKRAKKRGAERKGGKRARGRERERERVERSIKGVSV